MSGRTVSVYLSDDVLKLMDELGIKNKSKFVNDILRAYLALLKQLDLDLNDVKMVMQNPYSFALIFIKLNYNLLKSIRF